MASPTETVNSNRAKGYFKAPVNNALLDPLQGFDVDVWVADQATGGVNMIGRFTSLQLTVRDSTEPYLEFNQRVPRYLNGDVQIGFVLERGLIDTRLLQNIFGFNVLSREMRFNRGPRMQITFDINAPELELAGVAGDNGFLAPTGSTRSAKGQYRLTFCKPDSLTIGMQAGRSVIATRLEGLAEGIEFIEDSALWAGISLEQVSGFNALDTAAAATTKFALASNPRGFASSPLPDSSNAPARTSANPSTP